MTPAFERLHPGLQRWIWQQGWPAMRQVQANAIPHVLARDGDVVISAATAGGKTEAAFLPIFSDLAQFDGRRLGCICISPLKALINDQTRRLTSMAESVELAVQPWHGDVSAGRANFWKRPAHLLITTPESLEAMLMRRATQLTPLLASLRYVVVDELHAFFGNERGAQLQSLLQRLEHLAGQWIPRIALSATLGEPAMATSFLRRDDSRPKHLVLGSSDGGEIRLQVRAVPQRDEASVPSDVVPPASLPAGECSDDAQPEPEDRYSSALGRVADHLFSRLRGDSHLVFANARNQVEHLADQLRQRAEDLGVPNEFFPHHGALSRELRITLEDRLRDGSMPTTAVCTSTLEMGIDIGDVTSVAQIGPPPSVSALKQRIGRSGRRAGQAQVLRQYVIVPTLDAGSPPIDWLRLPLLQAIASVELMLAGRFEPPIEGDLHLSTLVQQILSFIAQRGGGATAGALYRELCQTGAFANVQPDVFAKVLRALGASKVIEQVQDGALLPGSAGEALMDHYSFYATFHTPEEYQLVAAGRRLGAIPILAPLTPGQLLLFAGRRWQVVDIDERQRIIGLVPARGGRPPQFMGGGTVVHRMVHEAMRDLLLGDTMPVYLDPHAQQALMDARASFRRFGLDCSPAHRAGDTLYVAHWAGTRIGHSVALWLQLRGAKVESEGPFIGIEGLAEQALPALIDDAIRHPPDDALALVRKVPSLLQDKFDPWLSKDVLTLGYAARHIDVIGAREVLHGIHARCVPS